jgi:hypothetical protein
MSDNLTSKKIKPNKKDKKRNIFSILSKSNSSNNMSKFDPITGEKIASNYIGNKPDISKKEALMEIKADAMKGRKNPVDLWEAAKNGTLGTSTGFVLGNLLNASNRTKGLLSLGLGGVIAANDIRRQVGDYNTQMAAREALLGKNTERKKAYINDIVKKYNINRVSNGQ